MQMRPEKGKAPTAATVEALSEVTQDANQGNIMSDSKAVQASSQPVFNFGAHSVRVVVRDGEPWFVASDVCAALDYKNTSDAVATHLDDDERMTIAAGDSHSNDSSQSLESKGKRGGARNLVVVNESGLYALVLRSRKPEARKFAKWVTSEVLPAIRKTGVYVGKPFTVNPGDVLTAEEQNTLRLMLKSAVEQLPKEKQAYAMVKGWSKLKAHFGVPYREIPRQEFSEAVSIIARHTAEWELVDDEPEQAERPEKPQDSELLKRAFSLATEVAASALRTVFDAVVEGQDVSAWDRWMFSLNHDREGKATIPWAKPIQSDAMVVSMKELPKRLAEPNGMMPSDEELANLAAACAMRLSARAASRMSTNSGRLTTS